MTEQKKIEVLTESIKELFDIDLTDEITLETDFTLLGLDSLDAVELQLHVEEKLNTRLSDPIGTVRTVADFLKLVP